MAKKSKLPTNALRVRVYDLVCETVESGISYGYQHAHKHTDKPDEDAIKEEIYNAIMNNFCEKFNFDNDFGD